MAGNLVNKHHFFRFTDEDVWESRSTLLEEKRSLFSSPLAWLPRSKLSRNIPKVEDQSDVFLCLSLAFKNRAPEGWDPASQSSKLSREAYDQGNVNKVVTVLSVQEWELWSLGRTESGLVHADMG